MSDQQRWWKMWCSILTDDDVMSLPVEDRWRWVALGTYIKQHGERGKITISRNSQTLALIFGVAPDRLFPAIMRLPSVSVEETKSDNGKITVTFHNWHYYQEDSTGYERVKRLRIRKREDKIREEKKESIPSFDDWYSKYPKKTARQAAEKAWFKLNPSTDLVSTILAALEIQKSCKQWLKDNGEFIPHPSTWLNQRRWEDEAEQPKRNKSIADDITPEQRAKLKQLTEGIGK